MAKSKKFVWVDCYGEILLTDFGNKGDLVIMTPMLTYECLGEL